MQSFVMVWLSLGLLQVPIEEIEPLSEKEIRGEASSLFEQLDANRDGFFTAEEAAKGKMHHFNKFMKNDADKDGKISLAEVQGYHLARHPDLNPHLARDRPRAPTTQKEAFAMLDRDRDWVLVGEEIPTHVKQEMKDFDKNSDGKIQLQEFLATMPSIVKTGTKVQNSTANPKIAEQVFDQFDKNNDGVVSKTEIPPGSKDLFQRLVEIKGGSQDSLTKDEFLRSMAELTAQNAKANKKPSAKNK